MVSELLKFKRKGRKKKGSGSISLTNGSRSGRPKNMQIQIWIPNTARYLTRNDSGTILAPSKVPFQVPNLYLS
jgi:hypothetical protein